MSSRFVIHIKLSDKLCHISGEQFAYAGSATCVPVQPGGCEHAMDNWCAEPCAEDPNVDAVCKCINDQDGDQCHSCPPGKFN